MPPDPANRLRESERVLHTSERNLLFLVAQILRAMPANHGGPGCEASRKLTALMKEVRGDLKEYLASQAEFAHMQRKEATDERREPDE